MHTAADPKDERTRTTETIDGTAVEVQHDRGIIYVYRRDGSPLLKITGLSIPVPELGELTIEIVTRADSERDAYLGAIERPTTATTDAEAALKEAGATVGGSNQSQRH